MYSNLQLYFSNEIGFESSYIKFCFYKLKPLEKMLEIILDFMELY